MFGLICFFKESAPASDAPIVGGVAKNVEIFFLSYFEKARVTNVVATLVSALYLARIVASQTVHSAMATGAYGSQDAFWKSFQQLRPSARHGESVSE